MAQEVRSIRRQALPNGLTIITEQMSHIRSASIGIWLETGSRDEDPEWNGISHFIEHMVFKGTKHRTAEEIARQVDSIGGNMDAFTSKESICFNVKVLDEHVPLALEILSDSGTCSSSTLTLKQMHSLEVKASMLPPMESTWRAISSAVRCLVPLKTMCSIKWEMPLTCAVSSREPVSSQMPIEAERMCSICSVMTVRPWGNT